jgi:hypothetical protein
MHTPSVDSPPRPPEHRTAARATGVLALCSALLLVLVVARWHPLLTVDGDIADTTHRWAVDEPGLTHAFRILTDWVWDPWAMRLLAAVAAVWLVWRRTMQNCVFPAMTSIIAGPPPLNGMCSTLIPANCLKSSVLRCWKLPDPAEA